jgi:hypothetical protein
MPKISRPVVFTLVASVVVYAIFTVTQPPAPTAHTAARVTTSVPQSQSPNQDADPDSTTGPNPADLHAHFARYAGALPDAFLPKVRPSVGAKTGRETAASQWTLTGIYAISGALHALVENPATGETAALRPGDQWRGLRVASIGANAVQFENALGQKTQLAFPQPAAPEAPVGLGPLPPMPVTGPLRPLPPLQSVPLPTSLSERPHRP